MPSDDMFYYDEPLTTSTGATDMSNDDGLLDDNATSTGATDMSGDDGLLDDDQYVYTSSTGAGFVDDVYTYTSSTNTYQSHFRIHIKTQRDSTRVELNLMRDGHWCVPMFCAALLVLRC